MEDVLEKVFRICLYPLADRQQSNELLKVYSQELVERLSSLESGNFIDQVFCILFLEGSYLECGCEQGVFSYLQGCHIRAERSNLAHDVVNEIKNLCLNYAVMCLCSPDVIQLSNSERQRGSRVLTDSMFAARSASSNDTSVVVNMTHEFFDALVIRLQQQAPGSLQEILVQIVEEFLEVGRISVLADYAAYFEVFLSLSQSSILREELTQSRYWLADQPIQQSNQQQQQKQGLGRVLEMKSVLGPFLRVSGAYDQGERLNQPLPNIGSLCFSGNHDRPIELQKQMEALWASINLVQMKQYEIIRTYLNKSTRQKTLQWIGNALNLNEGRAKIQVDPREVCSSGFMINLMFVLLQLSQPFLGPNSSKITEHVTASYLINADNCNFSKETRLGMLSDSEIKQGSSQMGWNRGSENYHFICECFFMTLKSIHLGLHSCMEFMKGIGRMMQQIEEARAEAQAQSGPQQQILKQRIDKEYEFWTSVKYQTATVIQEPKMLDLVLQFYQTTSSWMLWIAQGKPQQLQPSVGEQAPGVLEDPPFEFKLIPEYVIEDMVEIIQLIQNAAPKLMLQQGSTNSIAHFITTFIGYPQYIRNPYMRSKMVEVLYMWVPNASQDNAFPSRQRMSRRLPQNSAIQHMMESDPFLLHSLVPNLLQLYVDIEMTDRHNTFYEKFQPRALCSYVLEYLWEIPRHRKRWQEFANETGQAGGVYQRFCNMLINDSIFLLNESMTLLQKIKELEQTSTADQQQLDQNGAQLKGMLFYSVRCVRTMCYTTAEIADPFLLPEMVNRMAETLNYFLKYIVGPERKKLAIHDKEKYSWRPLELLQDLIIIYLQLWKADHQGVFVKAIASDERSYRNEVFQEAAKVLSDKNRDSNLPVGTIDQLLAMAAKVVQVAARQREEDELLMDSVPDEWLDPISYTLMRDPVIMPTSNTTIDRSTIVRHLLSDERDPLNRAPLKMEDLIPNTELKEKIDSWITEQKSKHGRTV
eukprot:TRINITY_DN18645_c0_g3_i1.p1 TRINITY_DN18645_c0_g3~~TRINITY_DN18645_c0_g3_i1.p1  ORF type:complete len:991 (-),score=66.73 TRINITY_DN18645_c0_g3_i1:343-3291(-)